jgi:formyltetrahydrofolate deformylase
MGETYVLRVECADAKGLIHKITGVLYRHGLNIIQNGEFVDTEKKLFFMRTQFFGPANLVTLLGDLRAVLPKDAAVGLDKDRKKELVLFVTKEPHCLGDLLVRHEYGEIHANIRAVIGNHDHLKPLVSKFKIPFYHVSSEKGSRSSREANIHRILEKYRPEYIVLAKYMRILSADFVSLYKNRVINIHHSFLPAFTGKNPYKQASERGVKIIGATAHFVTTQLDKGPIIAQDITRVDHSHQVFDMAQAGKDVEKIVLARALRLALEDRIFVNGNKTILFD